MEAPETIFVTPLGYGCLDEPCTERIFPSQIEYIRKDAFIEKAWNWIEDNILSLNQQDKSLLYYERFKKYLEE
jgi:hypothetical protein